MPDNLTTKDVGSENTGRTSSTRARTARFGNITRREQRRVVVVGAPGDVPRALEHPAVGRGALDVAAVLAVDVESEEGQQGIDQLAELLSAHEAEAILVAGPIGNATMRRVADLALLHHCELLAVMPTELLADHDPVVVWSGDSPLVQLSDKTSRRVAQGLKRALDVFIAGVGLTVLSPLIALLAIVVRIDSHGSPIFQHERIGYRGRRFKCLKLRTMRMDAEEILRADAELYEEYRRNHYKLPDDRDPRVTTLGRFLRRTSLDELPQLWNVLVGDMSLVGPRPVVEDELQVYGSSQSLLLSMRPGLTGAWAVSGRHCVGYPDRCRIELDYVRGWALRNDLRILFRTARVVADPLFREPPGNQTR